MQKRVILLFIVLLSCSLFSFSQEIKRTCYVYRTYEDLLSRKNGLERNYFPLGLEEDVFEYYVEGSKKAKKFKMKDSSYVGYETYVGKYLKARNYFNQKLGRFTYILGGDENYFMTGSGRDATVNYFSDGYASSIFGDQFFSWYFVKMEGDKQIYINNIIEIIKEDAELMKEYDAEFVKVNNVRIAKENDFKSDIKYLKLFLAKQKK